MLPTSVRGATSRSIVIVRVVWPLITNYPCIIAFRQDNLKVGTCPDPSSEGSGFKTMCLLKAGRNGWGGGGGGGGAEAGSSTQVPPRPKTSWWACRGWRLRHLDNNACIIGYNIRYVRSLASSPVVSVL